MFKSRPILITYSVLAGLGVITSAAGLGDLIGLKAALVLIMVREAVQVGVNFYTQSQVVPVGDVSAYVNNQGLQVAGPASGTSLGTGVAVVPTDPKVSAEQVRAAQLVAQSAVARQPKP